MEHIVTRLKAAICRAGRRALNEFERGRTAGASGAGSKLQQAEQRVQILLSDNEEVSPEPFIA
ncbi:exodeoxyribonuclease VII small subunit [Salmonella enterica subsp. enterica]|nr:exodeoxyribonuclease VII small subunit [Salmonella enterica subsp. enterica]